MNSAIIQALREQATELNAQLIATERELHLVREEERTLDDKRRRIVARINAIASAEHSLREVQL